MPFQPSGVLTFLSDFGHRDPFVGVMHGVAVWLAPGVSRIDLTHGIPQGDLRAGAFWLAQAFRWFPPGTTHVAVVDPGVGTSRAPLVIVAHGHAFVGPDNGLLAEATKSDPYAQAFLIPDEGTASKTFHGRDVFAPAGARLASGTLNPDTLTQLPKIVRSPVPHIEDEGAQVVVVDTFGNLLTNAPAAWLDETSVRVCGRNVPKGTTYADVAEGELVAVANAWGCVEIAVRGGSAADVLSAGAGTAVEFERLV